MGIPIGPKVTQTATPVQAPVIAAKTLPKPTALLDHTPALPDPKTVKAGEKGQAQAPKPTPEKAKLNDTDRQDAVTIVGQMTRDIYGNHKVFNGDSANKNAGGMLADAVKANPRIAAAVAEDLNHRGMNWPVLIADMDPKKAYSLVGDMARFIPPGQLRELTSVLLATGNNDAAEGLLAPGQQMSDEKRTIVAGAFIDRGISFEHATLGTPGEMDRADPKLTRQAYADALRQRDPDVRTLLDSYDKDPATEFRQVCDKAHISRADLEQTILTGKNPKSVDEFFKHHANAAHGKDAAVGELILRGEAGAAKVFAASSREAAASTTDPAEKDRYTKDADRFEATAKADAGHIEKFHARAKGASVGVARDSGLIDL